MTTENLPSTWKRLAANAIDEVIMIPFYVPFIGVAIELFFGDDDVEISLFKFALIMMIPAVYEFIFLVLFQATPAKWFLGLKVVPARNAAEHLAWQQCLLRAFSKRLTLFFSSAIYVVGFFRYDRTHVADWIAETRVVQSSPRAARPKIRWIIGSILLIYFCIEGWRSATEVTRAIDWNEGTINLSRIQEAFVPSDDILSEDI